MSKQEHQPDAPAEDEEKERLDDLEPSETDSDAVRGGVIPPNDKPGQGPDIIPPND